MDKKNKTESQANQNSRAVPFNKAQEQQSRTSNDRRQNETPRRHEEQQQKPGDRFPRESFEGGKENPR